MTFEAFQTEIMEAADSMESAVFLALVERIKSLEANSLIEAVEAYSELIRVYTHCRVYQHKVNRQVWRGYDSPCGFNRAITNNWLAEQERMNLAIRELNLQKRRLRNKLTNVGVNYRIYHPSTIASSLAIIQNPLKHAQKCLTI
jgi:hypothetical protein